MLTDEEMPTGAVQRSQCQKSHSHAAGHLPSQAPCLSLSICEMGETAV